ncbi:MAG: tripartite tricarboxylate transporter TctB family protein [Pseudomonadota bacterium]
MALSEQTDRPADAGRMPRDLGIGIGILAFCAAVYALSFEIREAPPALAQNVQPATFPRMVLGVIVSMTLIMMALGLSHPSKRKPWPHQMVFITGAMMVGFVIAFDTLGAFEAMVLFALIMPMLWGARAPLKLIAFALLFPLAVYLVFVETLGLYFPPGVVAQTFGPLF